MATEYVPKGTTDITAIGSDSNIVIFAEGQQQVTAGLDKSALTNGWKGLYLAPAFSGIIGGGGYGPLLVDVDVSPGLVINGSGGGELYIKPGGANTAITKLQHIGTGKTYLMSGGTCSTLEATAGRVNVTTDVIVTTLNISGGDVVQAYKSTANTTLVCSGGTLTTGRGITTGYISGSASVVVAREDTSATLPTATTLYVMGGAKVQWRGGAITTLHLYGGDSVFDMTQAPADFTLGTVNGTADALLRSGISSVSGGTITSALGAVITTTTVNVLAGSRDFRGFIGSGDPFA